MKKLLFLFSIVSFGLPVWAQKKKDISNISHRAADHFVIQLATDHWLNMPDSIKSGKGGFSRGANIYFMFDKQFKGARKLSVAAGLGISTSNIYFKKMAVDITSTEATLPFVDLNGKDHFKKYKLSTSYLEVPIELRFMDKPEQPNKAIKVALGIKVGTMLKAQTKGKQLRDADGAIIKDYIEKQSSKSFFNTTRFSGTARLNYGIYGVFASYSFTSLFKDGVAAEIHPLQVGISISGL